MKHYVFLTILLVSFNTIYSHEYDSLVVENKLWSEIVYIFNFSGDVDGILTTYYKFEGDTNIDGKTYKILYSCYADSLMKYWNIESFLREDSMKVYEYDRSEEVEVLLYDFSLLPGDTICSGSPVGSVCYFPYVESIDTILINGRLRKRIFFWEETWIEGIGSIFRPFEPFAVMVDIRYELLCCQQNNDIIYNHEYYSKCFIEYITGYEVFEVNPIEIIKIEPNPFSDYTYISINENISTNYYKLILFNLDGRIIKEIDIKDNHAVLNRENLMPGIYLVKIMTNEGSILHTKVIIK